MSELYTIGEFSQVTGLSVKTLRFYHEKGILVPTTIDPGTGYRFYDGSKTDKARIIMRLRAMEFSIEDIAAVIGSCNDEADILNHLERQRTFLQQRIAEDRDIVRSLNDIIGREKEAIALNTRTGFKIEEKTVGPELVAGVRMRGKYSDSGSGFSKLSKAVGRYIAGKALCLYYDKEYRDDDAEFEPCFPVRKEVTAEGIGCHTLPGARCLSLVHRGPYDQLGRSYAKLLKEVKLRAVDVLVPTREIYVKCQGIIFKGNPDNYLTEILLPVEIK
jgi:DNA-binding transcriptional MerR regulator/effector-binding domain-containing protein